MPGFLHDSTDIKILLLYIFIRLDEPTTFDAVLELALIDGGVTYFDVAQCLDSLVRTEHLSLEAGHYRLLDKGRRDGEITAVSLPYSVRVKAERGAMEFQSKARRDATITTSRAIRRREGYTVELKLSDDGEELMNLRLFAVSEARAEEMERLFRARAEAIYGEVIGSVFKSETEE